mmetsp:Transcript_3663/g.8628  ORF Transcript_3663/g.8628 Transcript_3663/m.8628 type:complete len:299 (-) Transcript_3663:421-1317(-)
MPPRPPPLLTPVGPPLAAPLLPVLVSRGGKSTLRAWPRVARGGVGWRVEGAGGGTPLRGVAELLLMFGSSGGRGEGVVDRLRGEGVVGTGLRIDFGGESAALGDAVRVEVMKNVSTFMSTLTPFRSSSRLCFATALLVVGLSACCGGAAFGCFVVSRAAFAGALSGSCSSAERPKCFRGDAFGFLKAPAGFQSHWTLRVGSGSGMPSRGLPTGGRLCKASCASWSSSRVRTNLLSSRNLSDMDNGEEPMGSKHSLSSGAACLVASNSLSWACASSYFPTMWFSTTSSDLSFSWRLASI